MAGISNMIDFDKKMSDLERYRSVGDAVYTGTKSYVPLDAEHAAEALRPDGTYDEGVLQKGVGVPNFWHRHFFPSLAKHSAWRKTAYTCTYLVKTAPKQVERVVVRETDIWKEGSEDPAGRTCKLGYRTRVNHVINPTNNNNRGYEYDEYWPEWDPFQAKLLEGENTRPAPSDVTKYKELFEVPQEPDPVRLNR